MLNCIISSRSLAIFLSAVYLGLLYGLYVPDWQFEVLSLPHSLLPAEGSNVHTVREAFSSIFLLSLLAFSVPIDSGIINVSLAYCY